ncbi:MAG TPA: enoyl-CoA hydratase/isomerase family protein [Candidatus Binataceae bacterium]|nr:enoyl-CoA hydratase/isomerase family protein [Candidatus Binataceae bacterium]
MPAYFEFSKDGAIATITFNRPDKRNPLNDEVILELEVLIHQVRDDREIRVLIVTGTGPAFSAGADLSATRGISDPLERARVSRETAGRFPRLIGRVFEAITHLDALTIGAINGYAIGGGWSLALAFDFCIVVEGAEFWVPEVDMGVPYRGAPAQLMAARMGPWRAREAILECRHYRAEELAAMGLVNRVVKREELMSEARALAERLAKKPAAAVQGSKRDINSFFFGQRLF